MKENKKRKSIKNWMKDMRDSDKKLLLIIVSVVSVLLIFSLVYSNSSINRNNKIRKADTMISKGEFKKGVRIYDKLLNKEFSDELKVKRDEAEELMNSEDNYTKGLKYLEEDDKFDAIKFLSKVHRSDEEKYRKALDKLSEIEASTIIEIERLIYINDLDEALEIVNNYLQVAPKNVKMQNYEDAILAKAKYAKIENEADKRIEKEEKQEEIEEVIEAEEKEKEDEQAKTEEEAKAKESAKAKEKSNKEEHKKKDKELVAEKSKGKNKDSNTEKDEPKNIVGNLQGTSKSIAALNANLRSSPSLSSGVITTIPQGTNVYIYDTKIESSDRVWCKVEVSVDGKSYNGWISYNTMNN